MSNSDLILLLVDKLISEREKNIILQQKQLQQIEDQNKGKTKM